MCGLNVSFLVTRTFKGNFQLTNAILYCRVKKYWHLPCYSPLQKKEDLKSKGYPEKLATQLHQNDGVVKVGNLLVSNLACHFPRVLGQGCRCVPYTFSETIRQRWYLQNICFQGLAACFRAKSTTLWEVNFLGCTPQRLLRARRGISGAGPIRGRGPWIRKKTAARKVPVAVASKKVMKKPAAVKSKRTFLLLNLTCSMVGFSRG